ncbi:hypothetical protein L0222_09735 [bacterium]|nr:hypothetical protein [bacterium]MCI0550663.1 hypothetical protein [Anaerolineae bacterium]MCI0610941.1 hypothetical protein [Anaerolineae bacterium]
MKVRYNKALGIGFIIFGMGLVFLGLLTGGGGGVKITFIIGGLEIWLGVTYLKKPYFVIDDNKLELYALAGNVLATYKFQSLKEIEINNNTMFLKQNGKRQKIKISTWMIDKGDWQKLLQKISSGM